MQHLLLVHVRKPRGQLHKPAHNVLLWKVVGVGGAGGLPPGREQCRQVATICELHHDEVSATLGEGSVVPNHVRVLQPVEGMRLDLGLGSIGLP